MTQVIKRFVPPAIVTQKTYFLTLLQVAAESKQ